MKRKKLGMRPALAASFVVTVVACGSGHNYPPNPPPQYPPQQYPPQQYPPPQYPPPQGYNQPPPGTAPPPQQGGRITKRRDGTCWQMADVQCPPQPATCNPPPPTQVPCPP